MNAMAKRGVEIEPAELVGLTFSDKDFTKETFISCLKQCSKGVPPEIAMRSLGRLQHFHYLRCTAEALPDSEEAKQLSVIDSYYHKALAVVLGHTFNHAMSEDGKTALSAIKLLLDLQSSLESKSHPIVVKDRK